MNNGQDSQKTEQDYLIVIFLSDLKEEIKAEVKINEPKNLAELMMKAR